MKGVIDYRDFAKSRQAWGGRDDSVQNEESTPSTPFRLTAQMRRRYANRFHAVGLDLEAFAINSVADWEEALSVLIYSEMAKTAKHVEAEVMAGNDA